MQNQRVYHFISLGPKMAAGDHGARSTTVMVPEALLSSGKPMPRMAMGTASFPLGAAEPAVVTRAILYAVEAGYRHFDTAAVYGTETMVGDAVGEAVRAGAVASRDGMYITSKLWLRDAHPGRVVPALVKTLKNLGMEYIDMYLIHFPVSMSPVEEGQEAPIEAKEELVMMDFKRVWEEMEECQRLGLTRAIGVSNFSCKKLETLLSTAIIPPAVNQVEVHPYCRQKKLREFCKDKGIQLCGYSPLGGKGTSWANDSVMDCPILKQIAQERGKTIAQVCLRWVYEQGDCIIVKSFNKSRLRENLDIFDWELMDIDRERISTLPESRGVLDFFVSESGPYKTTDEFWDGEITGSKPNVMPAFAPPN